MSPARAPRAQASSLELTTDWDVHSESQLLPLVAREQIIDLTCGRRWGKTDMGESWLTGIHPYATQQSGGAVWIPGSRNIYTAPHYSPNCIDFYEGLKESLHGLIADSSDTHLWIKLKHNRATIECLSLERFENRRGIAYDRLLLDEKQSTPAKAWYYILAACLADVPDKCLRRVMRIGTAKGKKHWTYREHLASQAAPKGWGIGTRAAFVYPTWARPGTELFVEDMRTALPINVFNQELGAEFLDEAAGYFQRILYTGKPALEFEPAATYAAGIDLAHMNDRSGSLVVKARGGAPGPKQPVALDLFGRLPWPETKRRIVDTLRRWNADALIDATSGGAPGEVTVEAFRPDWTRVAGFDSNGEEGANREALLMNLAVALEGAEVMLPGTVEKPAFPELTLELNGFEYEILPSGRARASAGVGPDGERLQDDSVIMLALACWKATQRLIRYAPSRRTWT